MTDYLGDSFDPYFLIWQSESYKNTYTIDAFLAWETSVSLYSRSKELEERFKTKFECKLLIKVECGEEGVQKEKFSAAEGEIFLALKPKRVLYDVWFVGEFELRSIIMQALNQFPHQYISVWGDWEDDIDTSHMKV
jgi:hypothetical protein